MPAKVKVRILAGRNLPVMDKSSDASDAFVEVKLGNTTYKTEVYRRSLNPFWNSEWFRFEVSDQELQDEPLQIRIMDYDTYSANDAIGKVYINLNPLLLNPGRSMNGWLPIYDTLHGIRGEINCMVKVNLFADNNRYRHSSCGVRFFFSDIPNGYKCDAILGFVDELLVNDDPEYQWIDKIRTPRASNEARQTLFTKLSGEVQRKLGLKAEIFGGNAVIGYQQSFDLEGGSGIVGRGIGTAVVLSKIGHQYEGVISPLSLNVPYPYYSTNPGKQPMDRSASQMFSSSSRKGPYSERHLVHSVSADYFYEVPTKLPHHKKLSNANESSSLVNAKSSTSILAASDKSDSETFVSLRSNDDEDDTTIVENCDDTSDVDEVAARAHAVDGDDDDNDDDDDDDSSDCNEKTRSGGGASSSSLRLPKNFKTLIQLSNLNKTLKLISSTPSDYNTTITSSDQSEKRNSSASNPQQSLITKLLSPTSTTYNESTNSLQKFVPSNLSATKLIKKLSHRRSSSRNSQSHSKGEATAGAATTTTNLRLPKQSSTSSSSSQQPNSSAQRSPANSTQSQSIDSSISSRAGVLQSMGPTGGLVAAAAGNKRKKERSLTNLSTDDTLSTIEEKFDDDTAVAENTLMPNSGTKSRVRLLSGSSSHRSQRQFVRTKEIDLSSQSISDDDDDDNNNEDVDENLISDTQSSSTVEDKNTPTTTSTCPPGEAAGAALLSGASSPSSSLLTDETIRAASKSPTGRKSSLSAQLSSQSAASDSAPNEAVGSSISTESAAKSNQQQQAPKTTGDLAKMHSSSVSGSGSSSNKDLAVSRPHQQQGPSFIQSVRLIKAQQHLLQNMIKHQNQNLVVHSMSKARNAFIYPSRIHQSEYPFVTLKRFPDRLIQCTGGVVSVHSVKLLDHIINDEESETRDIWWTEVRKEIRSHAKALNCNTILGYSETSKVLGDVCVLSARGTAAVMKPLEQVNSESSGEQSATASGARARASSQSAELRVPRVNTSPPPAASMPPPPTKASYISKQAASTADQQQLQQQQQPVAAHQVAQESDHQQQQVVVDSLAQPMIDCSFCHTPLVCAESVGSLPDCNICKSAKVPDVLLLTIEPPRNLNIVSPSTLVQARVCRSKRDSSGESSAKEIGDALPFLEYELHRQLFSKLKFKGMNCLFNLSIDISVGENMLTGVATGTGCFVLGLPTPVMPQISAGKGIKAAKLSEIRRLIGLSALRNRELLGLQQIEHQLGQYHEQIDQLCGHMSATITSDNNSRSNSRGGCGEDASLALDTNAHEPSASLVTPADVVGSSPARALTGNNGNVSPTGHDGWTESRANSRLQEESRDGIAAATTKTTASSSSNNNNKRSHEHDHRKRHGGHHNHHHHHHQSQGHSHHHHHHHHHHHQRKSPRLGTRGGGVGGTPTLPPKQQQQQADSSLVSMLGEDNDLVLEVDDNEDADIIALLIDSDIPDGFLVCNSETVPAINQDSITSINMFTQVMRVKLSGLDQFAQQFDWIIQALLVKQRRSRPCCLTNLNFVVDLPESHVVQITLTGCVLSLPLACVGGDASDGADSRTPTGGGECDSAGAVATEQSRGDTKATLDAGAAAAVEASTSSAATKSKSKSDASKRAAKGAKAKDVSASRSPSSLSPSLSSSSSATSSASSSSSSTTTSSSESSGARPTSSSGSSSSSSSSDSPTTTVSGGKSSSGEQQQQQQKQQPEQADKNKLAVVDNSERKASKQSITKHLSKGHLAAALITASKSTFGQDKRNAKVVASGSAARDLGPDKGATSEAQQEAKQQHQQQQQQSTEIRAAIKQDLLQSRLGAAKGAAKKPARSLRAVFKKQLTYPGATSPAISGQDNPFVELMTAATGGGGGGAGLKAANNNSENEQQPSTSSPPAAGVSNSSATAAAAAASTTSSSSGRKTAAASFLNKVVKQPLRDLGSNFSNSSPTATAAIDREQLLARQQPGIGGSGQAASGKKDSSSKAQKLGLHHPRSTSLYSSNQLKSATTLPASESVPLKHLGSSASNSQQQQQQQQLMASSGTATAGPKSDQQQQHHRGPNSSIDITSLSYIPGAKEYHYLGNLSFSFVRETNSVRENGGLNGFIHCFLMEVYAIVRAHVSALGGNAFLSFRLQQSCIFYHSNKNQAQCLISVAGDAAQVSL